MNTDFRLPDGTVVAGDYRVVRLIAEGGMGAVYLVEQVSTGRQRAFKVLHPRFVREPVMREKFIQESRVASRIASDHVVEVVSAGVDPQSGIPWMVMEYLQGDTLDAAVKKRGRLPHDEVREVFAQLGHALAAAHAVGIVHRDLKPENVMLSQSNRLGTAFTVKVLDFGIAKIVQDAYGGNTQAMGTPLWMAPEQTVAGERIGTGTDVWAMGLLAFYMLTGKFYWRMANTPDGGGMSVLRELLIDPIEAASARAAELGAGGSLPQGFDGWFARCVDRDISKRFRLAGEASSALLALFHPSAPLPSAPLFPASTDAPPTPPWNAPSAPNPALSTTAWVAPQTSAPGVPWTPTSGALRTPEPFGSQAQTPWHSNPGIPTPEEAHRARRPHRVSLNVIALAAFVLAVGTASGAVGLLLRDPSPPRYIPPPPPPPPPPPRVPVILPPAQPPGAHAVMTPIGAPPPSSPQTLPPETPADGNPFAIHSTWRGRYHCSQGWTNALLRIDLTRGDLVVGSFSFDAPQSPINGEYQVVGRWEESIRRLVLRPGRWIVHPSGWTSVGLDGRVSQDNGTYAGHMLNPHCSDFSLSATR